MPHAAERWTAERVRALPDDGRRYELVGGELVVTPAPSPRHQLALAALYDRIRPWLAESGIGMLLWSPADISLGEDEILQPDLFVIHAPPGRRFHNWSDIGELLLVIEVLSASTARHDRQLKRRRYQRAGVPEYWIVDLDGRIVERWRPGDERPEVLADRLVWQPDERVKPMEIELPGYFASVLGDQ